MNDASRTPFTVSIHERKDAPGFVVRLKVGAGDDQRVVRYPAATMPLAEELAASIRESIQAGLPIDIWMPEGG